MKQLTKRIFPLFLSLILMLSAGMTALASGEGNSCAAYSEQKYRRIASMPARDLPPLMMRGSDVPGLEQP